MRMFAALLTGCAALLTVSACSGTTKTPDSHPNTTPIAATTRPITLMPLPEPDKRISIFFTADLQGHLEPCGCTKDPLGGVDRLSSYLNIAKARPKFAGAILLDAGDLLFEKKVIEFDKEGQVDKAGLIATLWSGFGLAAAMTGPRDLAAGPEALTTGALATIPRLSAADPTKRRLLKEVGGLKIGVFGTASKESGAPAAADPLSAAKEDVNALTQEGAQQIIALAYGNSTFAQSLATIPGLNFIVLASGDPEHIAKSDNDSAPLPVSVDKTLILTPFSQGQTIGEIELRLIGDDLTLEDGGKPARLKDSADNTARRLTEMQAKINEAKQKKLDPSSLQKALAKLSKDYEQKASEAEAKIDGSHFVARIVNLSGEIDSDPETAKRKEDFIVGQGNKFKAAAKLEVLPEPAAGKPGYIGADQCADCHEDEYKFWQKTNHSHALETLISDNRDGQPECVECHVAGFRKPGGTTLVSRVDKLGGVQCENCHGPGSIHANNLGKEKTPSITPYPNESTCRGCHYPPHTNLFKFEERITKIVGPGHQYPKKDFTAPKAP